MTENTLEEIKKADLQEASPLQQSIISNIVNKENLVIRAKTGTNKHIAIAVGAREAVEQSTTDKETVVLVITDSSKNTQLVSDQIRSLGTSENDYARINDKGDADKQKEKLETKPEIIIANPKQLQNILRKHRFVFRHVGLVFIDELDKMITDGQPQSLKQIQRRILSDYRTVICTETFDSEIKEVSTYFAENAAVIGFGRSRNGRAATPPSIPGQLKQSYINVPYRMKISTLMAYIGQSSAPKNVIFTASKRGADRLYRALKKQNIQATSLHSKLADGKWAQRFANFNNSDMPFLLAADISGAQLELNNVDRVINYDVPNSSDEYRFRAALLNTGGSACIVSLVSKQDRDDISELQNELGQTPDEEPLPNEVKQKVKKRREKKSSNGRQKRQGKREKKQEMELPQPSYEKLSGGRNGKHNGKKTGVVKFFKKLFS